MGVLARLRDLFKPPPDGVDVRERFELITRIKHGTMSGVYRARDRRTGRLVALKVLDPDKTKQVAARLGGRVKPAEGELAAALQHPNIVRTFEYGVSTEGEQFLVMELLEGEGLNRLIEPPRSISDRLALECLLGLGRAVEYFHSKQFIHRDVCPHNVMVCTDGTVKIVDFGLAVPDTPEFRRPGNRTGKANYMAPELMLRSPTDQRIDIFSFGVTAYETLTGELPWEPAETPKAAMRRARTPPRDIRQLRPDLDTELADLVMRALAVRPDDRWQSMTALLGVLEPIARRRR